MTGAPPAEAGFSRRMPAALLALLVAARLAAVAVQPLLAERVPDWAWANNDGYDALAANWLATGAFSLDPGVPTSLRLPLYPALIALARLAAGPAYVWATMLLQAALSVATGVVLFRLATELFSRRVAAWTVVLFVVHPQVNNFVVRCATETLFTFLVAAFALAATRFARDRRGRDLVGAAAWLGLSLLTRPTLAALAWLGLASLLAWSGAGRRDALRRLGWTAAAAGTTLLIVAPWLARNWVRSGGEWIWQTWVGQPLCQGVYVSRHLDEFLQRRKSLTELDQACLHDTRLLDRRLSRTLAAGRTGIAREAVADRYFRARARQMAPDQPAERARRLLRNLLWAPVLQMTWRGTWILIPWNWPLLLLGAWGAAANLWKRPRCWREFAPTLALFAYVYVGHAATWPQARYVLPGLVPFLAFSAAGLAEAFTAWPARAPAPPARRPSST